MTDFAAFFATRDTRTYSAPPTVVTANTPTFADISDPFYTPPIWVRLNAAATVLDAAASYEDNYERAMRTVAVKAAERAGYYADMKVKLELLKAFTAKHKAQMAEEAEGATMEDSEPTSPLQRFGTMALLSTSAPPIIHSLPEAQGWTATHQGLFDEEHPFPTFSDGTSPGTSPSLQPIQQSAPISSQPLSAIVSPSPTGKSPVAEGSALSTFSSLVTNAVVTPMDLVAVAAEVTAITRTSIDRTTSELAYTDKVLYLHTSEYKGREAIVAEEGSCSGLGPARNIAASSNYNLLFHSYWLRQKYIFGEEVTLLTLNESQGRSAIEREVGTFSGWAAQSEPQWRAGVQRIVDERLAKEETAREEQRKIEDANKMRQLALDAMASEVANAEAKRAEAEGNRVKELARLRAEEMAIARRLNEQREAALAEAAAKEAERERAERQRKDEEYSRLLQAEEELQLKMHQERERMEAAQALKQQQQDEAYAKLLQDQIVLEERLRVEEEQIKARMEAAERAKEAAERAKEAATQKRHAELLAAEEVAKAAYEAKQRAIEMEKATVEEARLAKERERDEMLTAMLEAAKAEEDRLRLSQLHRVMTSNHSAPVQPTQAPMQQHAPPPPQGYGYYPPPQHAYPPSQYPPAQGNYYQQHPAPGHSPQYMPPQPYYPAPPSQAPQHPYYNGYQQQPMPMPPPPQQHYYAPPPSQGPYPSHQR